MSARASFKAAWASESDDPALRRLLRETPMPGRIRVSLEREPNFFCSAKQGWARHFTAVARESTSTDVFAMCSRSVRTSFINGEPVPLGYLSQLRVLPGHRGHKMRLVKTGFEWLRGTRQPAEAPFDITTLIEGNGAAQRLLTAGLSGLPRYTEVGRMLTFLMPVESTATRGPLAVSRGVRPELSGELLQCLERFSCRHQFAPCWTGLDFSTQANTGPAKSPVLQDFYTVVRGEKILGCAAIWDQRGFKQVVVRGYNRLIGCLRPLLNLCGAGLPQCGAVLPMAWVSHLAVEEDAPDIFNSLVRAIAAGARASPDLRWLALMLAERHPLAGPAQELAAQVYASRLYIVHEPGAGTTLDHRIPHLEGALL